MICQNCPKNKPHIHSHKSLAPAKAGVTTRFNRVAMRGYYCSECWYESSNYRTVKHHTIFSH